MGWLDELFGGGVPNAVAATNKQIDDQYGSLRDPNTGSFDLSRATPDALTKAGFAPEVADQVAQQAAALKIRQDMTQGLYKAPELSTGDKFWGALQVAGNAVHQIQSPGRGNLSTSIYDNHYDLKDKTNRARIDSEANTAKDFASGASDAVSSFIKSKSDRQRKLRDSILAARAAGLPVDPELLREAGLSTGSAPTASPVLNTPMTIPGAAPAVPSGQSSGIPMAPGASLMDGDPSAAPTQMAQAPAQADGQSRTNPNLVSKYGAYRPPYTNQQVLAAEMAGNTALSKMMQEQNEQALKQAEQITQRQQLDPALKGQLKAAEVAGQASEERVQAGKQMEITAEGVGGALKKLEELPDNVDYFDGVVGAFDSANPFGIRDQLGGARYTEMRDRIEGDIQSVLAVMKGFVRKPGEGAWSDADQMQLERQAGKVMNATDGAEFKRRIQALRERISTTFTRPYGVEVPGRTSVEDQATSSPPGESPAGAPPMLASQADYDALPNGAYYTSSDGKTVRRKGGAPLPPQEPQGYAPRAQAQGFNPRGGMGAY